MVRQPARGSRRLVDYSYLTTRAAVRQRSPQTTELRVAAALCDRGRPAEAITRLRALLADDPHDLEALGLLGQAQLADHDPDGARLTAAEAIRLEPEHDLAHRQASIAASRRGLHREAIAHAEEAVRLAPAEPSVFIVLARAVLRAKTDLPRARQAAVRAIVLAPDEAEPHLVFGMVSAAEGQHAAADGAFRRALQLDPGNATVCMELARLTLRRAALASFARATGPGPGLATRLSDSYPVRGPRWNLERVVRVLHPGLRRRRVAAESQAS
jgi:cytochrome c-type biogenesis protein CcmH/NrfG